MHACMYVVLSPDHITRANCFGFNSKNVQPPQKVSQTWVFCAICQGPNHRAVTATCQDSKFLRYLYTTTVQLYRCSIVQIVTQLQTCRKRILAGSSSSIVVVLAGSSSLVLPKPCLIS